MKTRTIETPKSASAKKTPTAKKPVGKGSTNTADSGLDSSTPKSTELKRPSSAKGKQVKSNEVTPTHTPKSIASPNIGAEGGKDSVEVETANSKVESGSKATVKKVTGRNKNPTSAKTSVLQMPKLTSTVQVEVGESPKKEETASPKVGIKKFEDQRNSIGIETIGNKGEETQTPNTNPGKSEVKESPSVEVTLDVKAGGFEESEVEVGKYPKANLEVPEKLEEAAKGSAEKFIDNEVRVVNEAKSAKEVLVGGKGKQVAEPNEESRDETLDSEEDTNNDLTDENAQDEVDGGQSDEVMEEYGDRDGYEEHTEEEEEDPREDSANEVAEEAEALEEEHRELRVAAEERKTKKECEIFVGGLDRDANEEDIRKVFEKIGEIVEVRLHMDSLTNKNKGYAFVKFANKDEATRALSETKNPIIRGKRCGTAPSEDNDSLFLGNICNTWTKEAIKQKLKDFGVEGVERITLVADPRHEGLSRGFAFLEFACHDDAMLAYKRLQKPDVVFGHSERTAKVAFAEPLREPDPDIMAQVKSVFVDGLPPHWDEDSVRENFRDYGEIERIVLARNMSTAKRKDFGFIDFSTHEAAIACIEGINTKEIFDGNSKVKMRARLSNPLPKTQAVKGGMCGGYRIGRGGAIGGYTRYGRGFGRGTHAFHRGSFQRGRGFYDRGRGHAARMNFSDEYGFDSEYPEFHGRQYLGRGGRRGSFGGAASVSSRPNFSRPRFSSSNRGRGRGMFPRRAPFSPEGGFDRPMTGRHFDDSYPYDDTHGIKRPLFMTDPDAGYVESSRLRPRLDYSDPSVSYPGTRYRDALQGGYDLYSQDYYGPEYSGGAYSSFYGNDRPYGSEYY